MRSTVITLALTLAPLAGCVAEESPPARYSLGGTLSEDFDEADRRDLEAEADARGADVAILESFPLQFRIAPLSEGACAGLVAVLEAKDYVQRVGECQVVETPEDRDGPTSSP